MRSLLKSRILACFLANVMAVVVFSPAVIAEHVPSDRAEKYYISSGGGYPSFTKELIIDPFFDVQDGEEQYLSIWAQDPAGIAEVTATVKLNEGDRLIQLQLAEGTKEEGRWEGTWIIENVSSNPKCKTEYRAVSESGEEKIAPISSWYPFPNQPPEIVQFQGPSQGIVGEILTFLAAVVDPEENQVCVRFKWNDWYSEWSEYQPSNSLFEKEYWPAVGSYTVQVQAKDSEGAESDWSSPVTIEVSDSVSVDSGSEVFQLFVLFQNYPNPFNSTTEICFALPQYSHVTFSATVVDPEENQVRVRFGWDNGQDSEFLTDWSEYQPSGSVFTVSHSWTNSGAFTVQVQAKDFWGNLSVWSSPVTIEVSDPIVSVDSGSEIPRTFVLFQNYPNPFNPITEIAFSLPEDSHITLAVFNSLGQQIAVLVEGRKEAGKHFVTLNAAGFPSGIYFYRLAAGGFIETRKMLLMR